MIEWNFNMDDAPMDGEPFLACDRGGTIPEVFYWVEFRSRFVCSSRLYSKELFASIFTAWAHINPPEQATNETRKVKV